LESQCLLFIVCHEAAVFKHGVFTKLVQQNPKIKKIMQQAVERELEEDFASLSVKKFILGSGKPHITTFRVSQASKVKGHPKIVRNSN